MDPLSISAGVAQVLTLAAALVKGLGRFIIKTRYIGDSIQEVHDEILSLQGALTEIKKTLEKRPRQLPFEREHHANIHRIVQSCQGSLETLVHELPQLRADGGMVERMRRSLEHSLKEERVAQIVHHITSYKTVLHLSLTTLSLGALWETSSSQNQIKYEIRKLTDAIRQSPHLFASRVRRDIMAVRTHDRRSNVDEEDIEEDTLARVIRDWRNTADDVATAVTLSDTDTASVDTRSIPPNSSNSVDTLVHHEDTFDPEPDCPDGQSGEILECQLRANQEFVQRLSHCGVFVKAASYQQRGIEIMNQLLESQDSPSTSAASQEKLKDMKEELADILLQCDTVENDFEAQDVLKKLLGEEVNRLRNLSDPDDNRDVDRADGSRRARLYHKLGGIYFRQGNVEQARKFLTRAFESRKRIGSMPRELVEESAELLVQVLRQDQAFDLARGLRDWMRRELHQRPCFSPSSISSQITQDGEDRTRTDPASAYQWCKEQGMDVDSDAFSFDFYDPVLKMTPMHRAIQAENIEVLRRMVSNVAHLGQRDASGSTLLHAAAAKRNRHLCAMLLEELHADPDVVDYNGMTPLHRCQTSQKGVLVAEMLLAQCPDLVDRVDGFGKTALYMACEKGNEDMVKSLLSKGRARPNIPGPGKRTPLLVAIDLTAQLAQKITIVELLLVYGAEPNIADADGRTALTAAKNAGLASSEIKRMLNLVSSRKTSTATTLASFRKTSAITTSSTKSQHSNKTYSLAELTLSR